MKLIKYHVDKKYIWPLRIFFLLASIPFVYNVYETVATSVAIDGKFTFVKGEHRGYYSYLLKQLAISLLLLWLGLFGVRAKNNSESQ